MSDSSALQTLGWEWKLEKFHMDGFRVNRELWGKGAVINSSSMQNSFFDQLRGRSPLFWAFILLVLSLNFWFDYYHPPGFVFDVIVVLVLCIKYLKN